MKYYIAIVVVGLVLFPEQPFGGALLASTGVFLILFKWLTAERRVEPSEVGEIAFDPKYIDARDLKHTPESSEPELELVSSLSGLEAFLQFLVAEKIISEEAEVHAYLTECRAAGHDALVEYAFRSALPGFSMGSRKEQEDLFVSWPMVPEAYVSKVSQAITAISSREEERA